MTDTGRIRRGGDDMEGSCPRCAPFDVNPKARGREEGRRARDRSNFPRFVKSSRNKLSRIDRHLSFLFSARTFESPSSFVANFEPIRLCRDRGEIIGNPFLERRYLPSVINFLHPPSSFRSVTDQHRSIFD